MLKKLGEYIPDANPSFITFEFSEAPNQTEQLEEKPTQSMKSTIQFNPAPNIDPDSVKLAEEIQEFAEANNISFCCAMNAVKARSEFRKTCAEFTESNEPFMQTAYNQANQVSEDQNIPYAKALIQVLDDAGFPWRKINRSLSALNDLYSKQDDPAQLQEEAQKRANNEGISLDKARKQVELESQILKSHQQMYGKRNATAQ